MGTLAHMVLDHITVVVEYIHVHHAYDDGGDGAVALDMELVHRLAILVGMGMAV
jgi:hypothetical protein